MAAARKWNLRTITLAEDWARWIGTSQKVLLIGTLCSNNVITEALTLGITVNARR